MVGFQISLYVAFACNMGRTKMAIVAVATAVVWSIISHVSSCKSFVDPGKLRGNQGSLFAFGVQWKTEVLP